MRLAFFLFLFLFLFLAALVILPSDPVVAQEDYGGGWAVPSLGTSIEITNEVGRQEMMREILEKDLSEGRRRSPDRRYAAPAKTGQSPMTGFHRSAGVQRESERDILAAIGQRQPEAVPQYRDLFDRVDFAKAFGQMVRPYELSADDAADALTAYWVMAWVVANKADLPDPAAVKAARDQVWRGLGGASLAGTTERRRQLVADEAIFNMMVLEQARRVSIQQGKLGILADATQESFLRHGVDLRNLALGRLGFARR